MTDALDIRAIPRFALFDLQSAIDDVIAWQGRVAISTADQLAKGNALVRLRQARWHVANAIKSKGALDAEARQEVADELSRIADRLQKA